MDTKKASPIPKLVSVDLSKNPPQVVLKKENGQHWPVSIANKNEAVPSYKGIRQQFVDYAIESAQDLAAQGEKYRSTEADLNALLVEEKRKNGVFEEETKAAKKEVNDLGQTITGLKQQLAEKDAEIALLGDSQLLKGQLAAAIQEKAAIQGNLDKAVLDLASAEQNLVRREEDMLRQAEECQQKLNNAEQLANQQKADLAKLEEKRQALEGDILQKEGDIALVKLEITEKEKNLLFQKRAFEEQKGILDTTAQQLEQSKLEVQRLTDEFGVKEAQLIAEKKQALIDVTADFEVQKQGLAANAEKTLRESNEDAAQKFADKVAEMAQLENQINALTAEIDAAGVTITEHQEQLRLLKAQLDALNLQHEELKRESEGKGQRIEQLQIQLEAEIQAKDDLREEVGRLTHKEQESQLTNQTLREANLAQVKLAQSAAENELKALRALDEKVAALKNLEVDHQEAEETRKRLALEVEELHKKLALVVTDAQLAADNTQLREITAADAEKIKALNLGLEKKKEDLKRSQIDVEELGDKLRRATEELKNAATKLNFVTAAKEAAEKEVVRLAFELAKEQVKNTALNNQVIATRGRLANTEAGFLETDKELQATKRQLAAQKTAYQNDNCKDMLRPILGAMGGIGLGYLVYTNPQTAISLFNRVVSVETVAGLNETLVSWGMELAALAAGCIGYGLSSTISPAIVVGLLKLINAVVTTIVAIPGAVFSLIKGMLMKAWEYKNVTLMLMLLGLGLYYAPLFAGFRSELPLFAKEWIDSVLDTYDTMPGAIEALNTLDQWMGLSTAAAGHWANMPSSVEILAGLNQTWTGLSTAAAGHWANMPSSAEVLDSLNQTWTGLSTAAAGHWANMPGFSDLSAKFGLAKY